MVRWGDRAFLPVLGKEAISACPPEWSLVETVTPRNPHLAPAEHLRSELRDAVPADVVARLPRTWMMVGDVALVRLAPQLRPHEALVAEHLADLVGARSVLALEGAAGELREPRTRLVWGDPRTETVHREERLTFHVDPARVLWSQGNHVERHRLVHAVRAGERVVDLFAGVGYFALPLARAGARVVACEKNPVAARYLRQNVEVNSLAGRVEVREGDCRDAAPEGWADRVVMGYFPGTEAFLDRAISSLAPRGGLLHYHTTEREPRAPERAWDVLAQHPALCSRAVALVGGRRVKSYAPAVTHVVLDVEVRP